MISSTLGPHSEDSVLEDLGDFFLDVSASVAVLVHVRRQLPLYVLHMVRIRQTVLRQNVHQLEEVVLDLVGFLVIRLVDGSVAPIDLGRGDQGQPAVEHILEDDLSNGCLLLHVLLHQLDQELVDQDLELVWDLVQVLRHHEIDNALQGGGGTDDLVLSLGVVPDKLAQNDDYVIVHAC
mmetsp:Transcript_1572/g.2175  ORF Transcript_1572/g.2175 Transcript_1572/m.2175 type:complete len:179 (+) Transcript_1572:52-588(+)